MGLYKAIALSWQDVGDRFLSLQLFKPSIGLLSTMGLVRLRIREYASEKGWTIKEVSERSGIPYTTVKNYAKSPGLATIDVTSLQKLARTFDVLMEDLFEVVKD